MNASHAGLSWNAKAVMGLCENATSPDSRHFWGSMKPYPIRPSS